MYRSYESFLVRYVCLPMRPIPECIWQPKWTSSNSYRVYKNKLYGFSQPIEEGEGGF